MESVCCFVHILHHHTCLMAWASHDTSTRSAWAAATLAACTCPSVPWAPAPCSLNAAARASTPLAAASAWRASLVVHSAASVVAAASTTAACPSPRAATNDVTAPCNAMLAWMRSFLAARPPSAAMAVRRVAPMVVSSRSRSSGTAPASTAAALAGAWWVTMLRSARAAAARPAVLPSRKTWTVSCSVPASISTC